MNIRFRVLLGFLSSLAFSILVGVSAPQIVSANPLEQPRVLPTGMALYTLPCQAPSETFAEGQLAVVDLVTGGLTSRGSGITDVNIRTQVGSNPACVTASTYDHVTQSAFFVTSYRVYNLESSLFKVSIQTGQTVFIGRLTPGNNLSGADSQGRIETFGIATNSSGSMYALWRGISDNKFYVGLVDKNTGNLSLVSEIQSPWNGYFVTQSPFNFSYFNNQFYATGAFAYRQGESVMHLYTIDVTTGNITSEVAAGSSSTIFGGFAIDGNGIIWSSRASQLRTSTVSGWPDASAYTVISTPSSFYRLSSFIGPNVAPVTPGTAPNSQVATIPMGVTVASIPATAALPATTLNFGGTVPTVVTIVPVTTNPAPATATPFAISPSTKIVDIQVTGSFTGSATVCLDGAQTDRLYHFTDGAWVELPSRSYTGGQVCGVTTSFSPFVAAPPSQEFLAAEIAAAESAARVAAESAARVAAESAARVAAESAAAAQAAIVQRELEKQDARSEITNKLKNAKALTVDSFVKAEIAGITASNIGALQAELEALPESSRTDINQVLKIAYKYEVVGKIGTDRLSGLQSKTFIEIGLIPSTSKNKISLVSAIRKLPASARDTYAEIKAAIDAETAEINARSERAAAIAARIKARFTQK